MQQLVRDFKQRVEVLDLGSEGSDWISEMLVALLGGAFRLAMLGAGAILDKLVKRNGKGERQWEGPDHQVKQWKAIYEWRNLLTHKDGVAICCTVDEWRTILENVYTFLRMHSPLPVNLPPQ